jgi:hypothetical protein
LGIEITARLTDREKWLIITVATLPQAQPFVSDRYSALNVLAALGGHELCARLDWKERTREHQFLSTERKENGKLIISDRRRHKS